MRGGDWGEDGHIVLGQVLKGLNIVPVTGGTPETLTTLNAAAGEIDHRYPIWLPGGKSVLFTAQTSRPTRSRSGSAPFGLAHPRTP